MSYSLVGGDGYSVVRIHSHRPFLSAYSGHMGDSSFRGHRQHFWARMDSRLVRADMSRHQNSPGRTAEVDEPDADPDLRDADLLPTRTVGRRRGMDEGDPPWTGNCRVGGFRRKEFESRECLGNADPADLTACQRSFSSAVHLLRLQQLRQERLLPVTPEVASSSLVDPAIYSLQVNNFQSVEWVRNSPFDGWGCIRGASPKGDDRLSWVPMREPLRLPNSVELSHVGTHHPSRTTAFS
jgi:hypothetical protein